MSPVSQTLSLLLVEDDPGHARLIEKNLRRAGIHNPVHLMKNGRDIVDYLQQYKDLSSKLGDTEPILILLDLNLPGLSGYQVLEFIKKDEMLRTIPIIILTTTDDPREVEKCYELGCNVYVTKPVDYGDFIDAIQKLGLFLHVVQLPRHRGKCS